MIELTDDIIQIARQEGWRTAAKNLARKSDNPSHHLEYITSEARVDFRLLLPLTKDDIVLVVCGGWGNLTTAFARTSRQVYSLNPSLRKLEFTKVRASQEGLTNITFIQTNLDEIPLTPESCNIALLSATLECKYWSDTATGSRSTHSRIFEAIWRQLVPGGCLYLGLENRFSYNYILGKKVPPSNLRFITLLPVSIAKLYARLFRRAEYQNITNSLTGIKKTLKGIGFSDIDIFFPIPSYPTFRFLTDFHSRAATDFMISRLRLHSGFSNSFYILAKFASSLGILPWVAPGFGVIAYKERT